MNEDSTESRSPTSINNGDPRAAYPVTAVAPAEVHSQVTGVEALLKFERFNLWYGKLQVLFDIDIPIPRTQVTALIGASGCGKTTLLRCVNRLNELDESVRISGDIKLGEESIYSRRADVIGIRKQMGMVFQKPNPFPMSIFENVIYPLRVDGQRNRELLVDVCQQCLTRVGLWDEVKDRLQYPALSLSGGQQQRLCIARALAGNPQVLLLDEPCSALDPIATGKIEDLIQELADSYTILMVTHNLQQASRISDYTALMAAGRVVEYGATLNIFTRPKLKETESYVTGRFG